MNNKITVSVIIPVYNATSYIHKCLDSLLNQSIENYEIICVNDASTDKTLSVLESYAHRYSNIVVINHQKNKRHGGARNTGIHAARGIYRFYR
ncbi:MAG: glycosyltransferase [Bacteroides sp.]|nr:glycosyltransferase [Bacteroides sp.]